MDRNEKLLVIAQLMIGYVVKAGSRLMLWRKY